MLKGLNSPRFLKVEDITTLEMYCSVLKRDRCEEVLCRYVYEPEDIFEWDPVELLSDILSEFYNDLKDEVLSLLEQFSNLPLILSTP